MNPILYYGVLALIFLLLSVGFFFLYKSISLRESFKRNVDKIYTQLAEKDEQRVGEMELERRKYGNNYADKGFWEKRLEKVDNMITYSGWGIRFKWLNTSTYILINVVVGGLVFLVSLVLFYKFILSFLLTFTVILIPVFWMRSQAKSNYSSVEKQLIVFTDMISNVSAGTNSLVALFKEVSPYMGEPLRSSLDRAVSAASMVGSTSECVRQLSREIEHPLFVRFIRNLEICARADADYRAIARDFSGQARSYIKGAEMRRAIFAKGRGTILLEMILGVVLTYACCEMLGSGFVPTLINMTQNIFGTLILCVEGMIYIGAILYMIFGMGE